MTKPFYVLFIHSDIKVAQKQEILIHFNIFINDVIKTLKMIWYELLLGLYEPLINHLLLYFLAFTSTQVDSMLWSDL